MTLNNNQIVFISAEEIESIAGNAINEALDNENKTFNLKRYLGEVAVCAYAPDSELGKVCVNLGTVGEWQEMMDSVGAGEWCDADINDIFCGKVIDALKDYYKNNPSVIYDGEEKRFITEL